MTPEMTHSKPSVLRDCIATMPASNMAVTEPVHSVVLTRLKREYGVALALTLVCSGVSSHTCM